jgi:S-DNA-T family DNA segregation ATPase FtsK/SpoIIIE
VADPVPGVIVSPAQYRPLHPLTARARVAGSDVIAVARVTRTVVTHERTKTVARNLAYIPAGVWVVWKHWRESHTNARYDRMIRAAEQCANWDELREWEARAELARDRRHKRIIDWIRAPKELVTAGALLVFVLVFALLALGGAAAWISHGAVSILGPIKAVMYAIAWAVWFVAIAGPILLAGVVALVVTTLWWVGRRAEAAPAWLAPANSSRAGGDEITSPRVILALRDLGHAKLRAEIVKMGDAGAMLSPIATAGCGVEFTVRLPVGVSTHDVMSRRRKFAENLDRHEHEVYLSIPRVARSVRVWAAESGALDEPIGPSPLVVEDGIKGDYRRGRAPWGIDLRGDAVEISLYQRHLLITGSSNQGKSRSLIALALWLALDPKVEFWLADLKGINPDTKVSDWEPFRGIASKFIVGPTDQHVIEATEMLEAAVAEMERRLMQAGEWNPLIVAVDEAQVAFMATEKDQAGRPYGGSKNNSRYFMAARKIQNQGRAVDVLLWQGTQNPTNQNLPVLVREGAHLRICLSVGREEQTRMALGDKAADGGAAPHLLRAGLDRGTCVVAGDGAPLAAGQDSITVRTHYINDADANEIAERAKARRGPVRQYDDDEVRDLLQDVHEEMRDDAKVRASHKADRLRETYRGYRHYRALDGEQLARMLREEGVEVRKDNGHLMVRAERVLRALDVRQGVE